MTHQINVSISHHEHPRCLACGKPVVWITPDNTGDGSVVAHWEHAR